MKSFIQSKMEKTQPHPKGYACVNCKWFQFVFFDTQNGCGRGKCSRGYGGKYTFQYCEEFEQKETQ